MNSATYNKLFSMMSLEQCVLTPTRRSNLVFTNRPEMVSSVEVTDNLPNTDHDYVEFYLNIFKPKQTSTCALFAFNYMQEN